MLTYFQIDKERGLQKGTKENHNWLIIDQDSKEELSSFIERFSLPEDIFVAADSSDEVSRIEYLEDTKLNKAISIVLFNLSSEDRPVEERIEPISFVLSDEVLLTYTGKNSHFIQQLVKQDTAFYSFQQVVLQSLLSIYRHFIAGLKKVKKEIDDLDQAARQTTDNQQLFRLADVDREVIFIDHILSDQNQTLENLWQDTEFLDLVNDKGLIFDVKLRQKQALRLVQVYHELIDTIGDLFASMIDNNLNHLMKYLESAALVLTIPAVMSGIWGMNTGGLPWEKSTLGFVIVMVITVILTILAAIYLKNKKYFN
ncbi:magnesium transporter CorA family protein [Enterococcus olivae]